MRLFENLEGARAELFLEGLESFENLFRPAAVTHDDDLVRLALLKEQRLQQGFQELGSPVMIDTGRDPRFRPGTIRQGSLTLAEAQASRANDAVLDGFPLPRE